MEWKAFPATKPDNVFGPGQRQVRTNFFVCLPGKQVIVLTWFAKQGTPGGIWEWPNGRLFRGEVRHYLVPPEGIA